MDAKISEKNLGDRNFHSVIVFFFQILQEKTNKFLVGKPEDSPSCKYSKFEKTADHTPWIRCTQKGLGPLGATLVKYMSSV